jgi:two-component system chemotaxis response regulator CheB
MSAPSLQGRVDAVVIGASAGGIESLSQILPLLPATLAAPIVVVLHLPHERPSLLVDGFAPKCQCEVREALDKEPLRPATIYFAPPDYHVLIDQGPAVALSTDPEVNYSRPSIDVLFESAADVFRDRLAAVVLSGANNDGAEGLRIVRDAGGVVIVQQPESASVRAMVEAALAAVTPDFVMSAGEIASLLSTLDGARA